MKCSTVKEEEIIIKLPNRDKPRVFFCCEDVLMDLNTQLNDIIFSIKLDLFLFSVKLNVGHHRDCFRGLL